MNEQMNKTLLLDKMQAGYAEMNDVLAQLNEEQMTTPGVNGEWSAKDVVAHLASWQRRILGGLRDPESFRRAATEAYSDETLSGEERTNRLNERFYQQNKARPLIEVLADFRDSYQELLAVVQAMPEEKLLDPNVFAWASGTAIWQFVAGNTFGHYEEHIEPLKALAQANA